MEALIFLTIVVSIVAFLLAVMTTINESSNYNLPICLLGFMSGFLLSLTINHTNIKPIDVYRGNTTLKITYVDSIPVDTVVVFKNEE